MSFLRKRSRGDILKLNDRNDLWQILVQLTQTRAIDQFRRVKAYQKHVAGESVLDAMKESNAMDSPVARIASRDPTPDEAAAFADDLGNLLEKLEDEQLQSIAAAPHGQLDGR